MRRSIGIAFWFSLAAATLVGCRSRGIVEIAAGKDNTCLRTEDGRVYCWGDDAYTQTKNPSFAAKPGARTTPKRVQGLDGASSLALAASHGCAGVKGGGVRCFLDVDLEGSSISGASVKSVRAFSGGMCALTDAGELKCWRGASRELPREPAEPPPGMTGLVDIATGERHVCVAHADGTVSCFGDDRVGQLGPMPPVPPSQGPPSAAPPPPPSLRKIPGLTDVVAVAAGSGHTCALHKTGRVSCWGLNELGQCGRASKPGEAGERTPVAVDGVEDAIALSAGFYHSCVVLRDGGVVCWGSNHYGELGRPPTKAITKAERVPGLEGASQIACGEWHTCAAVKGTIKCWGKNHRGQLGDGSNADSHVPVTVKLP